MEWTRGRAVSVVVVAVVFALGASILFPGGPTPYAADNGGSLTVPVTEQAAVWPYLSPSPSFDDPMISINVVVRADGERLKRYLLSDAGVEWNESRTNGSSINRTEPTLRSSNVGWADSEGGKLYVYVEGTNGSGRWIAQTFQVHHGDYFGHQYHVRAYELPNESADVTVLQAHTEHFDWFTITHTVDGLQEARRRLEADFRDQPFVEDIRRVYYGNGDTFDADGWATVVRMGVPLLAALLLSRVSAVRAVRRIDASRHVRTRAVAGLFASLLAVFLGVRAGGVAFERYLPWIPANVVVALLYPLLVAGVPICAYLFGRRLPSSEAFAVGAAGLGTAILLDYAYLGVTVLPLPVLVHRISVVLAAGLIAAGAPRTDDGRYSSVLAAGLAIWVIMVALGHYV